MIDIEMTVTKRFDAVQESEGGCSSPKVNLGKGMRHNSTLKSQCAQLIDLLDEEWDLNPTQHLDIGDVYV